MTMRRDDYLNRLPWSPTQIAVISLLLTPLAGGVLHALNYERLGAALSRKRIALFSNLISITALIVSPFFISTPFWGQAFALFASAYFYKSQEHLFQAHRSLGGRTSSLVLPIVLTIVVELALVLGVALLLAK